MSGIVRNGAALRLHTPARVGLAQAGSSIATSAQLEFQLDHALARDSVHAKLDVASLAEGVRSLGLDVVTLRSAVEPGAEERKIYLRRPDLGRRLSAASVGVLRRDSPPPDVVFVIADGLSALAVERHALPVMEAVMARLDRAAWRVGTVCVVSQGRVAIGDEIGERLGAAAIVMLIGERPGLSAPDSLGIYMTWAPRVGRTDAERDCISNVRLEGLAYAEAARRVVEVMEAARRAGMTGVALGTIAAGPLIA